MHKNIIRLFFLVLALYLFSPYYSAWKTIQAVKSGSVENMKFYIDFPKVQSSVKQQMDTALELQVEEDPMAGMFIGMFKPVLEQMVDELIKPEKMAELILSGKLQPVKKTKAKTKAKAKREVKNKELSWYAFYDRPNRFRIRLNELTLYMELQSWHWQVTAVGITNLINPDQSGVKKKFIADEIDNHNPSIPVAIDDIEALQKDISNVFYIVSDYGNEARVQGDFHYIPASVSLKPIVTWKTAIDSDGKSVLGAFSEKKLADRKRYHTANQFYLGNWSDVIPKKENAKKITSATGVCSLEVPTLIESYSLNSLAIKKLQIKGQTGVNLKTLKNGLVSLSYYSLFKLGEIKPIIIVRNAAGQPLKQKSSSSSVPVEPLLDARFKLPMRAVTTSINVAGTPEKVELYFPLNLIKVDVDFTSFPKPEVSFGILKSQVKQTRLAKPRIELPLKLIDAEELKKEMRISFHEKINYKKKKVRYLKVILPAIANSTFAIFNYSKLDVIAQGNKIKSQVAKNHPRPNNYWVEFIEPNREGNHNNINYDELRGSITIKYPVNIEIVKLKQGETLHGATLNGVTVTSPENGDIPAYISVFDTRSMLAFDSQNRQIAYLGDALFWNKDVDKVFFWGAPTRVEIKHVTKWIELKLPINLSEKDMIVDKQ